MARRRLLFQQSYLRILLGGSLSKVYHPTGSRSHTLRNAMSDKSLSDGGPSASGKRAGEERADNGPRIRFCWCPPGEFTMGSLYSEKGRLSDEDHVQVKLTQGFWLAKTEVTQGQWTQVMGTEPWRGEESVETGCDYAASHVSWDDATEFCGKLTTQERRANRLSADWSYRLPTEAQWEYGCRAGTTTRFNFGDEDSRLGDYAWYGLIGDGYAETEHHAHAVGMKKPNLWGLHDMHGNVYEWCQDWYAEILLAGSNPKATIEGSVRVLRGGCWCAWADFCRSASRHGGAPYERDSTMGFRPILSPFDQSIG